MAGLMDRLAAAKAKQGEIEGKKAAEAAAEKAKLEKEAKKGELTAEREKVGAEFAAMEQSAQEADAALAEVAAMEAQGEMDAEVKQELDTVKREATATKAKFEDLKTRLAALDQEIAGLEGGEVQPKTETAPSENAEVASTETLAEQLAEEATAEKKEPTIEEQEAQREMSPAEQKRLDRIKKLMGELPKDEKTKLEMNKVLKLHEDQDRLLSDELVDLARNQLKISSRDLDMSLELQSIEGARQTIQDYAAKLGEIIKNSEDPVQIQGLTERLEKIDKWNNNYASLQKQLNFLPKGREAAKKYYSLDLQIRSGLNSAKAELRGKKVSEGTKTKFITAIADLETQLNEKLQ